MFHQGSFPLKGFPSRFFPVPLLPDGEGYLEEEELLVGESFPGQGPFFPTRGVMHLGDGRHPGHETLGLPDRWRQGVDEITRESLEGVGYKSSKPLLVQTLRPGVNGDHRPLVGGIILIGQYLELRVGVLQKASSSFDLPVKGSLRTRCQDPLQAFPVKPDGLGEARAVAEQGCHQGEVSPPGGFPLDGQHGGDGRGEGTGLEGTQGRGHSPVLVTTGKKVKEILNGLHSERKKSRGLYGPDPLQEPYRGVSRQALRHRWLSPSFSPSSSSTGASSEFSNDPNLASRPLNSATNW
ncbi:MAG: hypothetical protein BWY01_00638 [Synergistetes bacterium ADurb.Bin155]|nr:MAG: hypothetical protein BWY01_00638 [Synergistetes bacterium ADurb.Bin155]